MKRQIPLSIVLTFGVLIFGVLPSLTNFTATAHAQQPPRRVIADTGIVSLGPNQVLRVRVAAGDLDGDHSVSFRRMGYLEQDNVYKVAAQDATNPVTLAAGEGASRDLPPAFLGGVFVGVRGVVLSSSRDVRVTAQIINTNTGEVVAVLVALLLPE